jgi:hypothetical protein
VHPVHHDPSIAPLYLLRYRTAELPFAVDIQGKPHHHPCRTLWPTDRNTFDIYLLYILGDKHPESIGEEPSRAEPSGVEPSGAEPSGVEPSGAEPAGVEGIVLMVDVTDLPGPPSVQATCKKINTLKRRAQEIARDQASRDDTRISYLEILEEQDNLTLAQMLAQW